MTWVIFSLLESKTVRQRRTTTPSPPHTNMVTAMWLFTVQHSAVLPTQHVHHVHHVQSCKAVTLWEPIEFIYSAWAKTNFETVHKYKNTTSLIMLVPFAPLRSLLMQLLSVNWFQKYNHAYVHVRTWRTCTMTTSSRHKKQYSRTSTDRYSLRSHCESVTAGRRPSLQQPASVHLSR